MSAYSDLILADSPLSYWDLQETSGTTFNDQGSASLDAVAGGGAGTLAQTGPLVAAAHASDKAILFNGTTDGLDVTGSGNTHRLNGDFTIEFWAKNASLPSSGQFDGILAKYHGSTIAGWGVLYDSVGRLAFKRNGVDFQPPSSAVYRLDTTWKHFCITYDEATTTVKWYVNGELAQTSTISYPDSTDTTHEMGIGWEYDAGGGNNYLAHVAVYDSELGANLVLARYTLGAATLSVSGADPPAVAVGRIDPLTLTAAVLAVRGVATVASQTVGRWSVDLQNYLDVRGAAADANVVGRATVSGIVARVRSRLRVRLPRR